MSEAQRVQDRLERPLRDLRISVTDRCNLRCIYCMPSDEDAAPPSFLPRSKILRFEEIERLTRLFVELGVRKLRITGGEPLLRRDLPRLIERLRGIDGVEEVALTTNALRLPKMAQELADAGVDRVTVSLDSLKPARFRKISGIPEAGIGPEAVFAGIEAAQAAGLDPIKINCVVQRGENDDEVVELARHFRGGSTILRFIEFMDVGTQNRWELAKVVPSDELRARIHEAFPIEAVDPIYRGEVARRYRYVDGQGEVGFISSVSAPFCSGCHRARLTTDGRLFNCLFATESLDLRTPLRRGQSDRHLLQLLTERWAQRDDRYSELRSAQTPPRRRAEMYEIGG
ncbi:MAG TPA: GTP 3',8-cyclase MoaA [Candidatus Krumholzibacteria bacterium]|jgi:cyclic pyranopterin phosphate synthase